jgi:methionine biosynthesis protein MetW
MLMEKGKCNRAVGIEISQSGVDISKKKGIDARIGKIDEPLPFKDEEFDLAICNVTIQMVTYPEILLKEMKRISKKQIISFPNFGFYKNRLDMLIHGRMPKPVMFGYHWFNTGHIHQLSISDFKELIEITGGMEIEKFSTVFLNNSFKDTLTGMFPNLFCLLPVFLLRKI